VSMAGAPGRKKVYYVDVDNRRTDDPEQAVGGEIAEYDIHGRNLRRTRFFLDRSEIPWLPVGESAFLLWVGIGIVLSLT
jgi:hypothetical protein